MIVKSLLSTYTICLEVQEERENHILAIESCRNKKIYDDGNKYIDSVIHIQGVKEYNNLIHNTKKAVFGDEALSNLDDTLNKKASKLTLLQEQYEIYQDMLDNLVLEQNPAPTTDNVKNWYSLSKKAKQ